MTVSRHPIENGGADITLGSPQLIPSNVTYVDVGYRNLQKSAGWQILFLFVRGFVSLSRFCHLCTVSQI